jgi:hypothetical protein
MTDTLDRPPLGAPGRAHLADPDPRQGTAGSRYLHGMGYLALGWRFVLHSHPSLIKLCLLPLLIGS